MWIVLALMVRLLWAGTNATDQILSRIHPRHKTLAALVLQFTCYVPCAAVAWAFAGSFVLSTELVLYCAVAVVAGIAGMIPYLVILQGEESYNVVPYLELTPVFFIALAYIANGEVLAPIQLAGAVIVILSGFLFSWDFENTHFKVKPLIYLSASSLCWAGFQYAMSRAQAIAGGVWPVLALQYTLASIIGLALFTIFGDVRKTVVETLVATKGRSSFPALLTSVLEVAANGCLLLAFRYAPTPDHVAALSGVQPLFSFALALPLARLFPRHFSKMTLDQQALAKLTLIISIGFGVYLLNRH